MFLRNAIRLDNQCSMLAGSFSDVVIAGDGALESLAAHRTKRHLLMFPCDALLKVTDVLSFEVRAFPVHARICEGRRTTVILSGILPSASGVLRHSASIVVGILSMLPLLWCARGGLIHNGARTSTG